MFRFYRFDNLTKIDICRHTITTKQTKEPYDFSVALHTGEDKEKIIKNRKKIAHVLGWHKDNCFIIANQTHSDHIKVIDKEGNQGWEGLEDAVKDCDALITNKHETILVILTADCVPILLCDTRKGVIAAVHAGWRGTQKEIVSKTVQKMSDVFDCKVKDIFAGVGPAIGACCYEVNEDVAAQFLLVPEVCERINDKFMIDLPLMNKIQLINAGLPESNIEMSGICTACEVEKFFSYRKEQGCNGRFMSMIGLVK